MENQLYRVRFLNENKVYEVYANHVYQGELYGFIVIEEIVFGKSGSVVVDPQEERLKTEFEGVKQTHIPMHAIIRIDQVEKQGTAKISTVEGNITTFPTSVYTPKNSE